MWRELLSVRVQGEGGEGAGIGVEGAAARRGRVQPRCEGPEVADGAHDVAKKVGAGPADLGSVRREVDMALQEK